MDKGRKRDTTIDGDEIHIKGIVGGQQTLHAVDLEESRGGKRKYFNGNNNFMSIIQRS